MDSPIEILTWDDDEDDDESAVPVESEAEIDRIFKTAKAVLAEHNLDLKRTRITGFSRGWRLVSGSGFCGTR